ncbi:hypothetical protein L211DRAFT_785916, partial [Terfezia boudieri ATCC MYA-4762]
LNDKAYQKMFEVLFSVLTRDKAVYVRSSKKGDILTLESSTLRTAVQHGVQLLKAKTVKNLIQHITGVLPHPRGGLCEPLKLDHIRSLRTVLEYTPHVENLPRSEWMDLVNFCCQFIQADIIPHGEDLDEPEVKPKGRGTRVGGRPSLSRNLSSLSRVPITANSKMKTEIEELMHCLHLLLQVPNAPIIQPDETLEEVATEAILAFLQAHKTLTSAHVAAYSALNCVLKTVSTNKVKLAGSIAREIPRLIGRPWESKPGPALKEEMLISLMYSLPHLSAYLKELDGEHDEEKLEDIKEGLDNLLETFMKEYAESGGKITAEQLQLDDIDFPDPSIPVDISGSPLTLSSFSLKADDSTRPEVAWMILQIIAMMVSMLDTNISNQSSTESRRKRRRKSKRLETQSRFNQILQQAGSYAPRSKTVALQLIPFLLEERITRPGKPLSVSEWRRIMADLSLIASEDSTVNSSWAMLGIARSVVPQFSSADT